MSIVLIGQLGYGKTTLYNKLTGSNQHTASGGQSATLSVFMKQSCSGKGFLVLDTPGFGSCENKMEHLAGVLSALAEGPVNKILIVTRYSRTDLIIKDVKQIIPAFKNYLSMIAVAVTFWDKCKKPEEQKQNKGEIIQKLQEIGINYALFISKNDTSESICSQIDQMINLSKPEIINLQNLEIYQNFELSDCNQQDVLNMETTKAESLTDYREFYVQSKNAITSPGVPEGQWSDYFYALTQFAKEKLELNVQFFEKKALQQKYDKYTELKSYEIHYELKAALFKYYKGIIDLACQKTSNGNHFSKFLKKCNYCHQIWLKVFGCDGLTACGRLIEDKEDKELQKELPPLKFKVSFQQKKLSIIVDEKIKPSTIMKNDLQIQENLKRTQDNLNIIEQMQVGSETIKLGGIGCKRKIEWSKMIPLTKSELEAAQGIFDQKMFDYLQEQEKLNEQRTQNLQVQYKADLEKKIQEQKEKMKK